MSKNVKISDASIKQLRRLPSRERILCEQIIRKEKIDATDVTCDTVVLASAIVLIEEFGFGSNTRRPDSRVKRYFDKLQELVDFAGTRYGDALAEALRKRLHYLGIDYERVERREKDE